MPMTRLLMILGAMAAVLALPTQAQAQNLYAGQYGAGGTWNIYEFWHTGMTWSNAYTHISTLTDPTGGTATGHMATIADANENAFLASLITGSTWIGLTDREGVAPNAEESQSFGSPSNQTMGWAWVDGTPFNFQSWNAGEPNDSTGEDAIELLTSGLWNDNKCGYGVDLPVAPTLQPGTSLDEATAAYAIVFLIEWETQFATLPVDLPLFRPLDMHIFPTGRMQGPDGAAGMLGVREVRWGMSTPTVVQAVEIIQSGLGTKYDGFVPTLDLTDPNTNPDGGPNITTTPITILSNGHGGATDDDNIQTIIKGRVYVPAGQGGTYSVQFRSDDGFALRFLDQAGNPVPFTDHGELGRIDLDGALSFPNPTGDSNSRGIITLAENSVYDIECVAYENGGGAYWEMTTMQGDYRGESAVVPPNTLFVPSTANWLPLGGTSIEEQTIAGPAPVKLTSAARATCVIDVLPTSGTFSLVDSTYFVPIMIEDARLGGIYPDENVFDSTIQTVAMLNPESGSGGGLGSPALEVSGLSNNFPCPTDDYFATGVTGSLRVDDGDGVSGESLQLTFAMFSDDNCYFEITGENFTQTMSLADDAIDTTYDINSTGNTMGMMFDAPTGNAQTFGLITVDEGEYDFEGYHIEIGGGEFYEVWVALGDYVNNTPDPTAFWPLTAVNLTQKVFQGNTALQLVDPTWTPGGDNADFNGDKIVDGNDFLIWQIGLGLTGQTNNDNGDANGDGTV
ncbi:MAG: hypothetical protein JW829_16095, partial [Pirellulales bacterium]|nr:hypothetical protein [Pirellulales bacterium]